MNWQERDKNTIWHPYTQMKLSNNIIPIVKGDGSYLIDDKDNRYLDAISSWWVTLHGHAHPYIAAKLHEQATILEQVIFAGFTHPKAVELSERLLKLLPANQSKLFYSDNGSTAVEVALKMTLQFWYNKGIKKNKIIAFEGAYHGDTFGSMSVSGKSSFTAPFDELLFDVIHIPFPIKEQETKILGIVNNIVAESTDICAFIFEPLIQGASGMRTYSHTLLNDLVHLCKKKSVLTIADEVMTGFGRTGKFFATDYIGEKPDIMCLSKGITGGFMPFGVTSCTEEIYNSFYSDDVLKTLFHGHSYAGNPLACALACASLDVFEKENTRDKIAMIESSHTRFQSELKTEVVKDIRVLGTILAIEIDTEEAGYFNEIGNYAYNYFLSEKILMRPLGNVIYVLPPYCITENELNYIYEKIQFFLNTLKP